MIDRILTIIKKKDDPIALRISIGGSLNNAYITYRGDLNQIKMLLDYVNEEFKQTSKKDEPDPSPDEGKRFA